ncbi:MAG: hypothetical protein MR963_04200 [Bacteroidales bacterium]|nr:hypothetical protein [Bacteroidales bacterium]
MKKQSEKFLDYKEKVVTLQAPSRMVSEPVLSYDLLIWKKVRPLTQSSELPVMMIEKGG